MKPNLPNSTSVLVLGIISLTTSPFCGGIILAIIALTLSSKPTRLYKDNPDYWNGYGLLNAGKICSIISIIINVIALIWFALLAMLGSISSAMNSWECYI